MTYQIVQASILHVRPMAKVMRAAAAVALDGFGFDPRTALRRVLVASHHAKTALIDGKPVAMWGVVGSLLGDTAYVWLVLSDRICEMPLAVVKEARNALAVAAQSYPQIGATVLPDDERSVRFATFLGFEQADRIPVGDGYMLSLRYTHQLEMAA